MTWTDYKNTTQRLHLPGHAVEAGAADDAVHAVHEPRDAHLVAPTPLEPCVEALAGAASRGAPALHYLRGWTSEE